MTSITTDGRALADAATLIRKLTDRTRVRAHLTVVDGRAELVATDGVTGIVEVVGTGSAPDSVRVAIAVDLDAIRKLRKSGDVTIVDHGHGATMTSGGVTSTLSDGRELPTWPSLAEDRPAIVVDVRGDEAVETAAALRSVARAAARHEGVRDVLRHVAITPGEAAATDSYRLNVATIPTIPGPGEERITGLVPASWIAAVPSRGVARLTIAAEDGGGVGGRAELHVHTVTRGRTRTITITGRTNGGPFPNYASLIPTEDDGTAITIPDGLGDVLGRMAAPTTVTIGADALVLTDGTGTSATIGTAIAPAITGPDAVDVNPAYLDQLAEHVGPGATLRVRDGLRAMVAEADGRTSLLMPMRVGR